MPVKSVLHVRLLCLSLLAFCFLATAGEVLAEDVPVVIIGNRNLPFDTLSKKELADIFKQKKTICENGLKLHVTILEGGSLHRQFLKTYLNKTPIQYTLYWKKLVFSGVGRMPMTFRSEKNLMRHVALTGGAIGYMSSQTQPIRVKVIRIAD